MTNTATRVTVSAIAIPVIVTASLLGELYFFFFVSGIAVISYYEFVLFVRNKNAHPQIITGLIIILLLLINHYYPFVDFYTIMLASTALIFLIELFRNKGSVIYNCGTELIGIIYIGLFSTALLGIREFYPRVDGLYERGGYLVVSVLAAIWICDSAAYFGGNALGKHKLFPRVSPNKSWEGALFGFVFSVLTFIAAKVFILDFLNWNAVITLGMIVGIIGQTGDLVESLIKRDAGVKDSSAFIPGHGGMFDRFDSLLYSSPFILITLKYFFR
ncbi:MAG: phosphatidate cytidylyltransferase [Ignavibacteriaceae bacterium]